MGEAPTIASDFKHQEKTDLHLSSIEFNEVHIVQENNSGTATVDGMIQVIKKKHGSRKSFIRLTTNFCSFNYEK